MFAARIEDEWVAGIGDPTLMGWLTVAAYFAGSLLCGIAAKAAFVQAPSGAKGPGLFWAFWALILAFLGVNKQLDLQTWLTLTVKQLAIEQGWYDRRRIAQAIFIACIALAGLTGFFRLVRISRQFGGGLALLGGAFLGCFVIIRASSFHHVDEMLGWRIGQFKLNWLLELAGIFCVALGAVRAWRAKPPPPPPYSPLNTSSGG